MSLTDRDMLVRNIWDRVEALESRVRALQEYAFLPADASLAPEQPNWAELSGWIVTGAQLQDVNGRIVLNPATPVIRIAAGGYIESGDFVAGTSGFQINGGTCEFNDVTVRGTIYATAGEIGGWSIASAYIAKDTGTDATSAGLAPNDYPFYAGAVYANRAGAPFRVTPAGALHAESGDIAGWTIASGHLYAGSGANRAGMQPAFYPFYAGSETQSSAPFRVDTAGQLVASSANITGTIDANAGHIGSLDVDGVLTVGASAPYIQIDGPNKRIQSSSYAAGLAGFRIGQSGDAEFNNVHVRGSLTTAVFVQDLIDARAGTMLIVQSAGALDDDAVVPGSGTWTIDVEDPPAGGFLFANGDICRIRSAYSGGVAEVWFTVASRTDNGDGSQRYTCTYQNGTRSVTYPAGAPVLDYGTSGDGGLTLTADGSNAPYLNVFTHAGSPWSALTEQIRLGNLNGWGGFAADTWGLGVGRYASNYPNMYLDATNGVLKLRVYNTDYLTFAYNAGSPYARIAGDLEINGGAVIAGGGDAWLDGDGIGLVAGNAIGNKIAFYDDTAKTTLLGELYHYSNAVNLRAERSGGDVGSNLAAYTTYPNTATVSLISSSVVGATYPTVIVSLVNDGDAPYLTIPASVRAGRGLYVGGTATDPDDNDIHFEGNLKSRKSSTDYDVYGIRYLTTPLTSTSFDGDTKSTGDYSVTQASFGWPTSAKAILVRLICQWTSDAGDYWAGLQRQSSDSYHPVMCRVQVANKYMENFGLVPLDGSGNCNLEVSGASVNAVWIQVWGYLI